MCVIQSTIAVYVLIIAPIGPSVNQNVVVFLQQFSRPNLVTKPPNLVTELGRVVFLQRNLTKVLAYTLVLHKRKTPGNMPEPGASNYGGYTT